MPEFGRSCNGLFGHRLRERLRIERLGDETGSAVGQHGSQTNISLDGIDNASRLSGGILGNEAVVICNGGGSMMSVKARCAVCAAASVTRIVTPKLPALAGVPVIEPPLLKLSPPGNAPATIE